MNRPSLQVAIFSAQTIRGNPPDVRRGGMWPHFVPGESSSTLDKLVIAGEDAAVFATFAHTASNTGRAFQTPVALHLTITDGKIVRLHLYEDTWIVSNAFSE